MDIKRAYLIGISGGGPHVLAFAAFHPDRVEAATVISGAAPLKPEEEEGLVEVNLRSRRLVQAGEMEELLAMYEAMRGTILADPLGALQAIVPDASEDDKVAMQNRMWLQSMADAMVEALKPGAEGWVDEGIALAMPFDFDPADISASVTWWHAAQDRNAPLSAAQRLVNELPKGRLELLPDGHIVIGQDAEFLDELLSRSHE